MTLRGVVALLGRFPALAGIDVDVDKGDVVLIQGPNGAGKSTLLRLCAGLVAVESGTATVLGVDLTTNRKAVRRRVGLLGQRTMLYDDLSIAENVGFWADATGVGRAQVASVLERLDVAAIADRRVGALSTGQRRRAAFASMIVRRPELWLLDEPHAGLDQAGRDVVDSLIADAIGAGATVLVASHELDRVRPIANRTLTIAGGADYQNTGEAPGSDTAGSSTTGGAPGNDTDA